jgi:hypothetical protein
LFVFTRLLLLCVLWLLTLLPCLRLGVLRRLLFFRRLALRLSMLLSGFGLLVFGRLLLRMVLLFAVLLLGVKRASDSESQREKEGTDSANRFHRFAARIVSLEF